MLENFNDFACFAAIIILIAVIIYYIFRAVSFRRLTKHIRAEQRYYKQWLDEEEWIQQHK